MAITTSLKLPEDLKDKVAELSVGVAQTPHAYMVEAIAERVARDEKRRAFHQAAEKSLAEVEAGGPVYAHKDVGRYIMALAAGKRARKPRPLKRKAVKR